MRRQPSAMGPLHLDVLDSLTNGVDTATALAEDTGRSRQTIHTALTQLEKAGLAKPIGYAPTGRPGPAPVRWAATERAP
ncbi:MAG: winged helix-turn-helix transcriptional regulator [bacterium]|nr:winged helix-turn-helix transcriptional regulator [bacterium]